jgi:hypothetical protein
MAKRRNGPAPDLHVAEEESATDVALLVQPQVGVAMSRLQRTFNGLVQEVAGLERILVTRREDLETLLALHQQRVAKPELALAQAQFALARALAEAQVQVRLRGNQKEDLGSALCSLCEDAFFTVTPDPQMEALYDEWSASSYRQTFERALESSGENFGGGASEETEPQEGVDEFGEDPASMWYEGQTLRRGSGGRRTADFIAREAHRAQQAETTRRSVREVYLSLARVLHPDAVADPTERQGREQAMKQATIAYRQNDLLALLRLELQWIRRGKDGRESPGDDTLRAYIRALREQVAKLHNTLTAQAAEPRYDAIAGIAFLPKARAVAELEKRAREIRAVTAELLELRAMVHRCESRQDLAVLVRGARHDRVG